MAVVPIWHKWYYSGQQMEKERPNVGGRQVLRNGPHKNHIMNEALNYMTGVNGH